MILRLLAFASVTLLALTSPALAAKGAKKGQKGAGKPGRVLMRFDRDHNGMIEGQEATRLQATYANLAALDTDKNGQLSDTEIAAVKVPVGRKAGKGKKAAAASTPAPPSPVQTPATPPPAPKVE